jgi:hypothetical protein
VKQESKAFFTNSVSHPGQIGFLSTPGKEKAGIHSHSSARTTWANAPNVITHVAKPNKHFMVIFLYLIQVKAGLMKLHLRHIIDTLTGNVNRIRAGLPASYAGRWSFGSVLTA